MLTYVQIKEASQYIAHRGAGGMQITGYLFGIESLVRIDAKYIQSPSAQLVKGGKSKSKTATKETTFA